MSNVTAKEIAGSVMRHVRGMNQVVLSNVYLLGSPWECDVIRVMPSRLYTEYEIKLTVADFRNDFEKTAGWKKNGAKKHDVLADPDLALDRHWRREYPRPKHFYFVTPPGLLTTEMLPAHAGLIEYDGRCKFIRRAPRLRKPTNLSDEVIWNITVKASSKAMPARNAS